MSMNKYGYGCGLMLVYGAFAYALLRTLLSEQADGVSIAPGLDFFGFEPREATLREYASRWEVRMLYRLPYVGWAVVFTLCTGLANWYSSALQTTGRRFFFESAALSLLACLVPPILSDVGSHLGWWRSGIFFGSGSWFSLTVRWRLPLFGLLAVAGGISAVTLRRSMVR